MITKEDVQKRGLDLIKKLNDLKLLAKSKTTLRLIKETEDLIEINKIVFKRLK